MKEKKGLKGFRYQVIDRLKRIVISTHKTRRAAEAAAGKSDRFAVRDSNDYA